jgi:perosamine synthetase
MKESPISMSSQDITSAEITAVTDVLATRYLSIGPRLEAFEHKIANYTGASQAVGVNSGTSGLHLAVIAAGVEAGDLVITTPFSFISSANCILYERAIPVFVDADPITGNINPAQVAQAAHDLSLGGAAAARWLPRQGATNSSGRVKALLPVDAFGQPADMDPLLLTAREHNLVVIEDACEAFGARYKGRQTGTLGDIGVFGFYPNKQITTGEGGIILTNRPDWADIFRSLRNQGRDIFDATLHHNRLGYNYRLDEMSAALGLAQMERIDELLAKRSRVATWYNQCLDGHIGIQIPTIVPETTHMSWFVYVIRVLPPVSRDVVMARLEENGIPSRLYFSPIHLQPFYRQQFGYCEGDFPITEELGRISLALPFSSVMTEAEVDQVCSVLIKVTQG